MAGWPWQAALVQDSLGARAASLGPTPGKGLPPWDLGGPGEGRRSLSRCPCGGRVPGAAGATGCAGAPGRRQSLHGRREARGRRGRRRGRAGNARDAAALRVRRGFVSTAQRPAVLAVPLRQRGLDAWGSLLTQSPLSTWWPRPPRPHVAALRPAAFAGDTRSSQYLLGCLRNGEAGTR